MGYFCIHMGNKNLSPIFINVCLNFIPFLSHSFGFFIDVQDFYGIWTTYGNVLLFVGCSILCMTYSDHLELGKIPLIGKTADQPLIEFGTKVNTS